jgi:hypothetical protein
MGPQGPDGPAGSPGAPAVSNANYPLAFTNELYS